MASRLIDKALVEARAGCGGDGVVSYVAHKLKRLIGPGMPGGGNGGRGGDVKIIASKSVRSLQGIRPVVLGGNGGHGKKDRANGSAGEDAIIRVPLGVTVYRADKENPHARGREVIADLDQDAQESIVAVGGTGGRGNNRANPHEATKGALGTHAFVRLELKTIADIGLVGFPNAGKSSLLRMVSRATPEVAPYPFTTLAPHVGTLDLGERGSAVTIADIPGLVEDAHLNRGMGHEFLRHIERTHALLFVLDSTCQHWNPREPALMGNGHIADVLRILRREIDMYEDGLLSEKPWGVVVNKLDGVDVSERLKMVDALSVELARGGKMCNGVVAVSAKHGIGKSGLIRLVSKFVNRN